MALPKRCKWKFLLSLPRILLEEEERNISVSNGMGHLEIPASG